MFCPNCGKELKGGKFCTECGAKIEEQVFAEGTAESTTESSTQKAEQQNEQESNTESNNAQESTPPIEFSSEATQNGQPNKTVKISKPLIISLIAIGVLILMIIVGAVSCGIGRSTAKSSTKTTTTTSNYNSSTYTRTYGIGQPVTKNSIRTTLVKVTESYGTTKIKPATGKKFVTCEFKIENRSTKNLTISSILCFEAYCDNISVNQSFTGLQLNKTKSHLDGKLASGKTMDGIIVYEVPKNWSTIEITVKPDISLQSSKSTFKVKK